MERIHNATDFAGDMILHLPLFQNNILSVIEQRWYALRSHMAPGLSSMSETVPVTFSISHVEPVRGCGRLVALAIVAMEVCGVELVLQGVQVVRDKNGGLEIRAPVFRHPASGVWMPAVILPDELRNALCRELLNLVRDEYSYQRKFAVLP